MGTSRLKIKCFNSYNNIKQECVLNNINLFDINFLRNENITQKSNTKNFYFTLWDNNKLIGVIKYTKSIPLIYQNNKFLNTTFISYVVIVEEFQHKGYGKILLEEFFNYLKGINFNEPIYTSPYSKMGWNYIRKYVFEYTNKYNINLIDSNYQYEY